MNYHGCSALHIEQQLSYEESVKIAQRNVYGVDGFNSFSNKVYDENKCRDELVEKWDAIGKAQPSLLTFVSKIHENK